MLVLLLFIYVFRLSPGPFTRSPQLLHCPCLKQIILSFSMSIQAMHSAVSFANSLVLPTSKLRTFHPPRVPPAAWCFVSAPLLPLKISANASTAGKDLLNLLIPN